VRCHVLGRFWSHEWRTLRWTLEDFGEDTKDRRELVAQLDQVNAYLLQPPANQRSFIVTTL
jgi:hypothetical protein